MDYLAQENEESLKNQTEKNTWFNKQKTNSEKIQAWFRKIGWTDNPFTFSIRPDLFVGYKKQVETLFMNIQEKHKIIFLTGPTGSGKTTLLRWVLKNLDSNFDSIYIGKPPNHPEEFVEIFNEKYKTSRFLRWFIPNIKNIYQLPDFLNRKTKRKHLLMLLDEAHESSEDVLEWLRTLVDQIDNLSVVVSGLPVFEDLLTEKLETFRKRIIEKIELISLTKEETEELIRKRIESVGGRNLEPFSKELINTIYERTGGFPREILRMCNRLVNKCISDNIYTATPDLLVKEENKKEYNGISLNIFNKMTPTQKHIIELLKEPLTPGQIADSLNLQKYKSRQHAVRSMNNILKQLMKDNLVERKKKDRAFVYQLSPKIKTLVVKR